MLAYIAGRLLQAVPVLVLATIAVFGLMRLLPGDPAVLLAGGDLANVASPEVVEEIRQSFGLDQPLPVQYGIWLAHVARGDLGESVRSHLPVWEVIASRIPATLQLTAAAIALTMLVAFPLGILAAVNRGRRVDVLISIYNGIVLSIPGFWLSILAILLFALALRWLPAGGFVDFTQDPIGSLKSLILPATTLALPAAAGLSRLVRSSMLDVLGEDYVRTARAKGLASRAVIVRHALRNALVPVATVLGLQLGRLLGGSVITESVFSWPGVGRLIVDAIAYRDYAVVQGTLLLFVVVFIGVNLLTDISYGLIDPRIRLAREGS